MHLKKNPCSALVAVAALLPVIFIPLQAQSTAAQSSAQTSEDDILADEEILMLPEFVITADRDRGYFSANSLGGTRTNALIKDTPMTISVVNQDLIQDFGLYGIDDLSKVLTGIEAEGEGFSDRLLRFRGFVTRFQLFEFMPRQMPQDSYNIERAEVIKGSNSLIYGQADPGGKINFLGKQAQFGKDFVKTQGEVGNKERRRFDFDFNTSPNDDWALRIMGVIDNREFNQDYKSKEFKGMTLETTYKLSPKTRLRGHFEFIDETRNNPISTFNDRTGQFGLTGIPQDLPVTPDIVDYLPQSLLNQIINFNDGTLQDHPRIWNGSQQTVRVDINSADDIRNYYSIINPQNTGTISGPDQERRGKGTYFYGDIIHSFTDKLQLKVGLLQEDNSVDILKRSNNFNQLRNSLAGGAGTINAPASDVVDPFIRATWAENTVEETTHSMRATLSYTTEIGRSKQQFLLGYDFDQRDNQTLDLDEAQRYYVDDPFLAGNNFNDNGTPSNFDDDSFTYYHPYTGAYSNNLLAYDYFNLNDGFGTNVQGIHYDDLQTNNLPIVPNHFNQSGDPNGTRTVFIPRQQKDSIVTTHGVWGAASGKYLKGRLNTLLGLRLDMISVEATTNDIRQYKRTTSDEDYAIFSPSAGALFWLNKNYALFGNVAHSTLAPTGFQLDVDGKATPPEEGLGYELGIKFELMEGKVNGQINAFVIDKTNEQTSGLTDQDINALYPLAFFPQYYDADGTVNVPGRNLSGDTVRSKGIEAEVYWNPNNNWSIFAGYALMDAEYHDSEEYKSRIGERYPGTAHHNLNLTARYTIKQGKLKGLYCGGNFKYRSEGFLGYFYEDIGRNAKPSTHPNAIPNASLGLSYEEGGIGPGQYDGNPDPLGIDFVDTFGNPGADGIADTQPAPKHEIWLSDNTEVGVFLGWRGKVGKGKPKDQKELNIQLTINNLFDQVNLVTSGGGRAYYTEDRSISLRGSLKF